MALWKTTLQSLKPLFEDGARRHDGLRVCLFSGSPEAYDNLGSTIRRTVSNFFGGTQPCGSGYGYEASNSIRDNRKHVVHSFGDVAGAERFRKLAALANRCVGPYSEHLVANWQDHQISKHLEEPVLWVRAMFAAGRQPPLDAILNVRTIPSGWLGDFDPPILDTSSPEFTELTKNIDPCDLELLKSVPGSYFTLRDACGAGSDDAKSNTEEPDDLELFVLGIDPFLASVLTIDTMLGETNVVKPDADEELPQTDASLNNSKQSAVAEQVVPEWNHETGELRFNHNVAKRVKNRSQAKNITRVLQEFQELGWPPRIDDPLEHPASAERTNKTVESLNRGLDRTLRFAADGSGLGFCWKAT